MLSLHLRGIYFKEWINCNILYVKDLIDETGAPKSENIMFNVIRNKTKIIEQLYKFNKQIKEDPNHNTKIGNMCLLLSLFEMKTKKLLCHVLVY